VTIFRNPVAKNRGQRIEPTLLELNLKPGIAVLHKPFTSETLGRKIRDLFDV
jgi:hypothetical protein